MRGRIEFSSSKLRNKKPGLHKFPTRKDAGRRRLGEAVHSQCLMSGPPEEGKCVSHAGFPKMFKV